MRLHGLLGLLLALEDDVAGGIVDPLYSEMRVDVEVVSDQLVAHVVHPEQVPRVRPQLYVFLCEVGHLALVEELCIVSQLLSSVCTFSSG